MLSAPQIHKIRERKSPYGFLVRTRDRLEMTEKTLPPLLMEKDIDVYWVDGSVTAEGQALASGVWRDLPGLCEVHTGITYGHMGSWAYGLRRLLGQGHEYVGFLENDILLEPGWFQTMCDLYKRGEQDGLHVGSVSARCIEDRILVPRDGYAVMANIGAGMSMYRQDVFLSLVYDETNCVLTDRAFQFSDLFVKFRELCGLDYPFNWRIKKDLAGKHIQPGILYEWVVSNDWWWETILMQQGLVALAPTPSFARNLDEMAANDIPAIQKTSADPAFNWQAFTVRLNQHYKMPAETEIFSDTGLEKTST